MLKAARDKYRKDIDIVSRLGADGNEEMEESHRNIVALFKVSVFHNSRGTEDERLLNDVTCGDFEDDAPSKAEQVLKERIVEAIKNGLSKTGKEILEKVI